MLTWFQKINRLFKQAQDNEDAIVSTNTKHDADQIINSNKFTNIDNNISTLQRDINTALSTKRDKTDGIFDMNDIAINAGTEGLYRIIVTNGAPNERYLSLLYKDNIARLVSHNSTWTEDSMNLEFPKERSIIASRNWVNKYTLCGIPLPFPSNQDLPAGYVVMVGQDIDASHTRLRALYGTHLPDMRDRYIRGANGSKGGGPRTLQDDTMQHHTHLSNPNGMMLTTWRAGAIGHGSANTRDLFQGNTGAVADARVSGETRPLTITFNYICAVG